MDHHSSPTLGHFRASLEAANQSQEGLVRRRSVEVRVHRYYPPGRPNVTDINNNQTRIFLHPANPPVHSFETPNMTASPTFMNLPPVSLGFSVLQLIIYFFREELFNVTAEEDVYVSWKTVIAQGQVWRLLYAQFFHFGRVLIFFNIVTLMAMGRYLEKKIRPFAFAWLILLTSVISNLMYVFLNDIFCHGPHTEYTIGFGTVMFSLRMIHIFTMDSEANNGKGDPNLIFGFLPVHLPTAIAPWQPLLETIFFDVAIIGKCVAAIFSGMLAGMIFPYLMKNYRNEIMLPRNPPPPPPRRRSRHTISRRSSDSSNNNDPQNNNNHLGLGHLGFLH